jgi:hypothetical protein
VVVNGDTVHPLRLLDDGAGQSNRNRADFSATDCHYSAWFTPTDASAYTLELYVAPTGGALDDAVLVHSAALQPNTRPELAVITDLRELFKEFNETSANSSTSDTNDNCVKDYYDAVERLRRYAEEHNGVVLDVRQDAYVQDYVYHPGTTATRRRMGEDIDTQLILHLESFRLWLSHLAIIGDDAVVPFYRIPVPNGTWPGADETTYPGEVGGPDGNPTQLDSRSQIDGAIKGHLMSDVPYSTFRIVLDNPPRPRLGVGRIFYSTPLQLEQAIDAYEQPLDLRTATSSAVGLHLHNEPSGVAWVTLFNNAIASVLRSHYTVQSVHYTAPETFVDGQAYIYDGAATPWNAVFTTWRAVRGTDLVIFYSHADQFGWKSRSGRNIKYADLTSANCRLVLSPSCHAGYNNAYYQLWNPAHPLYRRSMVRAFLDRHAAYFALTVYGFGLPSHNTLDDLLMHNFLTATFTRFYDTIGDAYYAAFLNYRPIVWSGYTYPDMDKYTTYGTNFFGLPTQPLRNQSTGMALRTTWMDGPPALNETITLSTTEHITISHFAVSFDDQGRARFDIPHQGDRIGEPFGPVLPAVYRTYPLPLQATAITVTLLSTQTHPYTTPVDLQTTVPYGYSFGPLTGTFTYTNPYPASILATPVVTGREGLFLNLIAVPWQYDPATRLVTLYDHVSYHISYLAPATVTVPGLVVNNANPVPVGSSAVPVSLTLESTAALSGTLVWAVEDGAGTAVAGDWAELDLLPGTTILGWDLDTTRWSPGARHLWVTVRDPDGQVIASGWTDFPATGQWLTAEADPSVYDEGDSVAEVHAEVRDETGAGVGGQAGNLALSLDGSATGAGWDEGDDGRYTATVSLAGLVAGSHAFSVTWGTFTADGGFLLDLEAPTSTVWLESLGTLTNTWVHVGWGDDATGPMTITVDYQVDGGPWEYWRAFRPGYVEGDNAIFGPTDPIPVDLTQHTYCFRSQATDWMGHQEAAHTVPDVCIAIAPRAYLPVVMRNSP